MAQPAASEPEPAAAQPPGPDYPLRVFGSAFEIDPSTSGAYRGWRPQSYPHINVSTENAATWSVGVRLRVYFVSVEQARYESNGVSSPRVSGGGAATKVATGVPAAAWFIGAIGFPFEWILEPIVRYEARSFQSTLTPQQPIRVIPQSASANDDLSAFPATMQKLRLTSAFETMVVALQYRHDNDPTGLISSRSGSFPSIYFGAGLVQYWKPYMVRVGDAVLNGILFDARLRGAGLALGFSTPQKPDSFYIDFSGQLGLGEVKLTDGFTLNETLPKGWLIGYGQGDLTAGYLYPLIRTRPTLMVGVSGSIGGATFFYFKPTRSEGDNSSAPALNWDLLWGARANMVLPL